MKLIVFASTWSMSKNRLVLFYNKYDNWIYIITYIKVCLSNLV